MHEQESNSRLHAGDVQLRAVVPALSDIAQRDAPLAERSVLQRRLRARLRFGGGGGSQRERRQQDRGCGAHFGCGMVWCRVVGGRYGERKGAVVLYTRGERTNGATIYTRRAPIRGPLYVTYHLPQISSPTHPGERDACLAGSLNRRLSGHEILIHAPPGNRTCPSPRSAGTAAPGSSHSRRAGAARHLPKPSRWNAGGWAESREREAGSPAGSTRSMWSRIGTAAGVLACHLTADRSLTRLVRGRQPVGSTQPRIPPHPTGEQKPDPAKPLVAAPLR